MAEFNYGLSQFANEDVKAYINKITKYKQIKQEEETELAKLAKKGDKYAKNRLIKGNLRLVISVIKTCIHKTNIPVIDLIQEGNIALIASLDKFNPDLGYKFSTYATWWVKQAVFKAISEQGNCVKIPVYIQETLSKYNKMKNKLEKQYGIEIKKEEVCEKINIEVSKIDLYLNAFSKNISLNAVISESKDNSMTYGDVIEDEKNNLDKYIEDKSLKEDINFVINLLNTREKDILKKRFNIGDEYDCKKNTLEEIGREYGVTKECIRQIEKKAIKKIKNSIKFNQMLSVYI